MKNVQKIIALLVASLFMFGCNSKFQNDSNVSANANTNTNEKITAVKTDMVDESEFVLSPGILSARRNKKIANDLVKSNSETSNNKDEKASNIIKTDKQNNNNKTKKNVQASSTAVNAKVRTAVNEEPYIAKTRLAKNSSFIIAVIAKGSGAKMEVFQKNNGIWSKIISTTGFVGMNGVTYNKREGDGKTPVGAYSITQAFGIAPNPGTGLNYRNVTANDYWVDDVNSDLYNSWQNGPSNGRWNSAEQLIQHPAAYKYGTIINYNTSKAKGKGSAIFLHCSTGGGTAGCVSTSEGNIIRILRSMNSSLNPYIIIVPNENAIYQY